MSPSNRKPAANTTGAEAITLASVLGALLRDLGEAQSIADAHAQRRQSGAVAQLIEAEVDLRFAIDETAVRAVAAAPARLTAAMLQPAASAFAQAVIRCTAGELRRQAESAQVVENLTSPEFAAHLTAAAAAALQSLTAPEPDAIIDALRAVADREVLDDRSVARAVPYGTEAREAVREHIAADAHRTADRVMQLVRGAQAAAEPEVRVIVAAERLGHVAPELLARIHFKARLDDDRFVGVTGG